MNLVTCLGCCGAGKIKKACEFCDGAGKHFVVGGISVPVVIPAPCEQCSGSGRVERTCLECGGAGEIEKKEV